MVSLGSTLNNHQLDTEKHSKCVHLPSALEYFEDAISQCKYDSMVTRQVDFNIYHRLFISTCHWHYSGTHGAKFWPLPNDNIQVR